MALSRATRKKLILLGGCVALVAVVCALYLVRQARLASGLERDLREGMAAYESGKYAEAIPHLSRYVGRRRENPEVLLAFADSRRRVPAEDGTPSHLRHSLAVTRLALELDPDSEMGRRMLMEIALQMGYFTEADEAASALLEQNPADFDALQVKLLAARQTGRDEDRVRVAHQLADARPDDFGAQLLALQQLIDSNVPLTDLEKQVEESKRPFEGRMASELLLAHVALHGAATAPTPEEREDYAERFASHIEHALTLKPTDPIEAITLFQHLDTQPRVSATSSPDEVLTGYLSDPELAPGLWKFALARAWQRSDSEMVERIAAGQPEASELDSDGLGWLAVALPAEPRFREELEKRSDASAENWKRIVRSVELLRQEKFVEAREAVAPLMLAGDVTTSSLAKFVEALSLRALGETSLAEQHLRDLADQNSWVRARVVLRELAWQRGDFVTAHRLLARDNLPGTALLHLEAAVSLDESGYTWPDGQPSGRQLADRALLNLPDDPVIRSLHGRAELAAGNSRRALTVADELAGMEIDGGNEYVLKFADRLEAVDPERAARLRERFAVAAADALQQLMNDLEGTRISPQELRPRIEAVIKDGSPELRLRGEILLAGMLDEMGDPSAAAEFERLSAEHPDNAQVQTAALHSRMLWRNPEAVPPVVGRLRSLTGEDGVAWRVFQYKLDLLKDTSEAAAARAVNGLSSVLRLAPNDTLALRLMAEAMTRVGDFDRAAGYTTRAADAAPENLAVALDAVDALVRAEQMEEATAVLRDSIAKPDESIANRTRRAVLLTRFGFTTDALNDWTWLAGSGDPETRARAAVVLAQLGRTEEAASVVSELLALEPLAPATRAAAAAALATLNRVDEGLVLLEQLEDSAEYDREAMIAEYLAAYANSPEDIAKLEELVRGSDSSEAWAALIRRYMGEGQIEEARRVLADGRGRVADPSALAAFERALDPETTLDPKSFLAVAQANLTTVDAEWSRELSDRLDLVISGQETLEQFADYLRGFVRSRPSVLLGWMLLAQAEATLGDLSAVRLTTQTMLEAIPADPAAATYATGLFRRLGMHDEGLLAAREYAERLDQPTLESARNIALFALATNRAQEAWDAISPWKDHLDEDADLSLYARAALATGRARDAEAIVWTRSESDTAWLHETIGMGEVIESGSDRKRWLERAGALMGPDDHAGRFLLANGWYQLALDTGDATALERALELTQADAPDAEIEASLSLLQGSCLSQLGRAQEAIAAYRHAIELKPDEPDALNNLAYLLIETGGSTEEALGYSQKAVEVLRSRNVSGDRLVEYLDTLGTVMLRAGRPADALAVFDEALRARPAYDFALVGLAETLAALDRDEEAREALGKLGGNPSVALEGRVRKLREQLR